MGLNVLLPYRLLRLPYPAAAAGTSPNIGSLGALAKLSDEPFEVRVLSTLQGQLFTPGGGYHEGVLVGVGAREYHAVLLGEVSYLAYLLLSEVGLVGDPDCPMLKGVHGVLVAHGLIVEAAVLQGGVVRPPQPVGSGRSPSFLFGAGRTGPRLCP
jgi:hypothetical protein